MSISSDKGKKSYLKIRNQCGILGILLPWLALFSAGIVEHPDPSWWWSISATYYLSPVLAAVMMPVALVLFNYIGYDKLDNIVTKLCSLFALGIVLFPCKVSWFEAGTKVGFFQIPIEISGILHSVCSVSFFGLMAFNSIFLFTKSKPGNEITKMKKIRNMIYRICGSCMIILAILAFATSLKILPKSSMMVIEILLLNIFGLSWLVKGEFFHFLNDKE